MVKKFSQESFKTKSTFNPRNNDAIIETSKLLRGEVTRY